MENLDPGTEFGAYTIEGLIAGGGMGSVYAARHTVYGTPCALKVLHPKLHGDESWRKRFEAEGFAGTTLKHPHVLAAREVVLEDDDQIGLVLDLVQEGLTLHRVMSREYRTGVPLAQALRVFLGVVQGIEYAHAKEIVHGDIKPENVLIQGEFRDPSTWQAKVTDFGTIGILAHPVEIEGMPAVVVSPRYASPEHLKGMVHLEPRSDIYCLGLLLHYMLTGRHCSSAKSVEDAAARVAEPTSTTALLNQPEAVSLLFRKATERKREDRFQTARDLALAVRDLLDQIGEGLDLDDLQADLATEIVEEQADAAKKQRAEARRAAAEAAVELDPSLAGQDRADVQVSEVATPLGDLPVDDFEASELVEVGEVATDDATDAVSDAAESDEPKTPADPVDAEGTPPEQPVPDVFSIDGDDVEEPSTVQPIDPVDAPQVSELATLPDDRVEVLPDTPPPAPGRALREAPPTEELTGEAILADNTSEVPRDAAAVEGESVPQDSGATATSDDTADQAAFEQLLTEAPRFEHLRDGPRTSITVFLIAGIGLVLAMLGGIALWLAT